MHFLFCPILLNGSVVSKSISPAKGDIQEYCPAVRDKAYFKDQQTKLA